MVKVKQILKWWNWNSRISRDRVCRKTRLCWRSNLIEWFYCLVSISHLHSNSCITDIHCQGLVCFMNLTCQIQATKSYRWKWRILLSKRLKTFGITLGSTIFTLTLSILYDEICRTLLRLIFLGVDYWSL